MPNVSSHGAPPAVRAASLRAKASMAQSRWSVSSRRSLHRMSNQYVKHVGSESSDRTAEEGFEACEDTQKRNVKKFF
jgi:hypothetical protein